MKMDAITFKRKKSIIYCHLSYNVEKLQIIKPLLSKFKTLLESRN